jgi:small subunit ribosomal protein S1
VPKSKIADEIKRVAPDYDYSQLETMDDLLDSGDHEVNVFRRGEVIDGVVVRVQVEEVMLDVGLKAEGVVVGRELFDPHLMDSRPELEIGESIPVYVVQPEGEGAAMLSIRRAMQEKLWRETEILYNEGKIIESRVTEFNKGGVLVDVGPRGFVPMSQLVSLAPAAPDETREDVAARLSELVNKTLKLKIIEMDRRRNRLILSERAAERELRSERREQLLDELQVGQIRKGRVSNLASFGAFIDLGGADGLAHISELSWSRVSTPGEILQPGAEVDVYILSLDRVEKKIALSIRRGQPDPWSTLEDRFAPEMVVEGTVTKLAPFGVFVRLEEGVEGLAHASDIGEEVLASMREEDVLNFRILSIESRRRRIRLTPAGAEDDMAEDGEGTVVGTSDIADTESDGDTESPAAEADDAEEAVEANADVVEAEEAEDDSAEADDAEEAVEATADVVEAEEAEEVSAAADDDKAAKAKTDEAEDAETAPAGKAKKATKASKSKSGKKATKKAAKKASAKA